MVILIAEDEEDIRNMIEEQLSMEGYTIRKAIDGFEALQILQTETVDLTLLDIMMPKLDGFAVLRKIRERSEIPVIFITARGDEMDRVSGLTMGADDYLVKPFSLAELSARVAVQCRHIRSLNKQTDKEKSQEEILECGPLSLNQTTGIVMCRGEQVTLNAKEYQLLQFFMENKNRVLTKKQIYQAVWGEEYLYDDNTIMVHLSRLRNKIELSPKEPEILITLKGIGYKLQQR